jgi:hypothetical protein
MIKLILKNTKNLFYILFFISNTLIQAQNWYQVSKITPLDRAERDEFGYSVSINGIYAIVGAHKDGEEPVGTKFMNNVGSAYVFVRLGGKWGLQQKLIASDREKEDKFGTSVAISGRYAIVGAPFETHDTLGKDSLFEAGSAYIFERFGDTWKQVQKLVASDRGELDYFGHSVAIDGNFAIVGAYNESHNATGGAFLYGSGSAYIFELVDGKWIERQKIVSSNREWKEAFGKSVSISGDYALVGAYLSDKNSTNPDAGAAYFFKRSGNTWSNQQKVIASSQAAFDHYGFSVSISGNSAIVGAYYAPYGIDQAGTAYIYTLSGNTWTEQQKIGASDYSQRKFFGWSVGISGNHAIVGAYNDFHDAQGKNFKGYAGAAYIFARNGNEWKQQKIVASDRNNNDYFGYSVAINGDYSIVGAIQEDENFQGREGLADAGSAYIFKDPNGTRISNRQVNNTFIFPNPFNNTININNLNLKTNTVIECHFIDIHGKIVYKQTLDTNNSIDTKHLPSGFYTLRFINGITVSNFKIMKK